MGSQALRVKLLGQPRMDPPNKKLGKASEVWWFSRQQLWVLHQTKPTGVNCQVWLKNDDYLSTKHGKIHQQTCLRIESTSRVKNYLFQCWWRTNRNPIRDENSDLVSKKWVPSKTMDFAMQVVSQDKALWWLHLGRLDGSKGFMKNGGKNRQNLCDLGPRHWVMWPDAAFFLCQKWSIHLWLEEIAPGHAVVSFSETATGGFKESNIGSLA
jgi:hypothetical protein